MFNSAAHLPVAVGVTSSTLKPSEAVVDMLGRIMEMPKGTTLIQVLRAVPLWAFLSGRHHVWCNYLRQPASNTSNGLARLCPFSVMRALIPSTTTEWSIGCQPSRPRQRIQGLQAHPKFAFSSAILQSYSRAGRGVGGGQTRIRQTLPAYSLYLSASAQPSPLPADYFLSHQFSTPSAL